MAATLCVTITNWCSHCVWLPDEEGAVAEAGHDGLGHPLEVHVAGEDGQVRVVDGAGRRRGVPVRQQDVEEELQGGLPPGGLAEQDHCLDRREVLVKAAEGG